MEGLGLARFLPVAVERERERANCVSFYKVGEAVADSCLLTVLAQRRSGAGLSW